MRRPDAEALGCLIMLGDPEIALAIDGDPDGVVHLAGVVRTDGGLAGFADGADGLAIGGEDLHLVAISMIADVDAAIGTDGQALRVFQALGDEHLGLAEIHRAIGGGRGLAGGLGRGGSHLAGQHDADERLAGEGQQAAVLLEGDAARIGEGGRADGAAGGGVDQQQLIELGDADDQDAVSHGHAAHAIAIARALGRQLGDLVGGLEDGAVFAISEAIVLRGLAF